MSARSSRLSGPALLPSAGPEPILVAAPGEVLLVKSLRVVNLDSSPRTFSLWLNDATDAGTVARFLEVPAFGLLTDVSWWVMEEGDALLAEADAADELVCMIAGARLHA